MTSTETVDCFGCGRVLHEDEGRYHVRPAEHYCSKACIEQIDPEMARALQQWNLAYPAEFLMVI